MEMAEVIGVVERSYMIPNVESDTVALTNGNSNQ